VKSGQERAAEAVENRRAALGLRQTDLGVDASTYRTFIKGRHWPNTRSRAKIEEALGWKAGHIAGLLDNTASTSTEMSARITDDPDEQALLASDLPDDVKRRLIARLWATERP
jgi:hypothetical protein